MDARLPPPGLDTLRAGLAALLVHVLFFALLVFGLQWQKQEPEPVVAELWSDLPAVPRVVPPPPPPVETRPEPVKAEPPPAPKVEAPKPDIALKSKSEPKKEPTPPAPKPVARQTPQPKPAEVDREALLERQLEAIQKQQAAAEAARAQAANQSVIGEYKSRIKRKIRGYLNRQPCGEGNPQLEFDVALLPTGQLRASPVLRKGSGIPACDRAVEYAIVQADPLPVPPQPEIFSEFRNLHLIIRPNDPND